MASVASNATVFIVDDDRGLLRLIEKVLRREGFSSATASSGQEAKQWLACNQADLMLLDLKLPDIEGKDLIHHLAETQRGIPFIVITGQGDERIAVEMMKFGAVDYLVKDVDFLQFVPEVVRRAMKQIEQERKLAAAEEGLRRNEANLAKAQEMAQLGSYEIHIPSTREDHWSKETFRILGLALTEKAASPQEFIDRSVHPEDRARVREMLQETLRQASKFDFAFRVVRPDGSVRHVQSSGEPIQDQGGRVVRIVGTLMDITERKRLENEILHISEREQRRIGQDLHDGLCQHLAGIEFMSQVLAQRLASKAKAEAASAAEIAKLVRAAISHTRDLARGLSPVVLESNGLMSALKQLAENTEKLFRVSCRFQCDQPVLLHDNAVATHLYRIAQEAISNALKHGQARHVTIHLTIAPPQIVLLVKDDGVGLPKIPRKHQGMGLRIMQYRAGMVGGSLTVQRDPDGGTSVACSLASRKKKPPAT